MFFHHFCPCPFWLLHPKKFKTARMGEAINGASPPPNVLSNALIHVIQRKIVLPNAKTCYPTRTQRASQYENKLSINAKTCCPPRKPVIQREIMLYPTRKRVIQRENVLSNAKTCYLKRKRVIQRENVLSIAKTCFPTRKHIFQKTC